KVVVLGRASYTSRVLCTDLRPCFAKLTTPTTEVVALRAIVSAKKSTPDKLHARLAHVGMDTIRSSVKHEVATGLDLKSASAADSLCVSCVGGKLARHTFTVHGSDANDVLAVVHIDLCGLFRVTAKDASLYFLLLKDHKTRYVWVRPVVKKRGVPREGLHHLHDRQGDRPQPDLPVHTAAERHGGAGDAHGGGVGSDDAAAHGRTAPLMAPRFGTCCLGPQLSRAVDAVAGDDIQRGGKLKPKARWGLHLGESEESKGWELLDITDNQVFTTSDVVFYETMLLEVWKSEHGLASGRTQANPPTDTLTATPPPLAKVDEPAAEDVEDVPSPFPSPAPPAPPLVADLRGLTPVSASGDEWRSRASPVALAKSIAGDRGDVKQVGVGTKLTPTREQQAKEVQQILVTPATEASAKQQQIGEQIAVTPTMKQSAGEPTAGENSAGKPTEMQQDNGGDTEESTDSDVVEVQTGPRHSGQIRRPPDFYVPAAFTTAYDEVDYDLLYDDAEKDEELPELDPDMHADPEHRWDISTMTAKEVLAS
ncbi:unnamed protein product, partial [Closterium sp. NIES-53]